MVQHQGNPVVHRAEYVERGPGPFRGFPRDGRPIQDPDVPQVHAVNQDRVGQNQQETGPRHAAVPPAIRGIADANNQGGQVQDGRGHP